MTVITKQDYTIGALVGFLAGVFVIPTAFNVGIKSPLILALLPLVIPPVFVFGVWFGKFLSRWIPFFAQFGKFAAVGFLSATIDFGILNILSNLTGITAGFIIGGVNVPGFSVAVVNGYLWNKLWVFQDRDPEGLFHDFPKFLAVTTTGLFLNSGIVILITTYIPPLFLLGGAAWLNVAKVAATAVILVWNFAGYKFVVFRKNI